MTIVKPGMKFGKITAIARDGASKHKKATWRCVCDCGKYMNKVVAGNLVSGGSKSCGCVGSLKTIKRNKDNAKHGMGGTAEYNLWYGVLSRCNDKNDISYKNYGARGIKVCEFISSHPKNLFAVVGKRPEFNRPREFSVDRVDNDKNYSCGKCTECIKNGWIMNLKWSTQKQQCRNTRHNTFIDFMGERRCIAEWAEIKGLKSGTIVSRIKLGWPVDRLFIPLTK